MAILDASGDAVDTWDFEPGLWGLDFDPVGRRLYIVNKDTQTVVVMDVDTGMPVSQAWH